MSNQKQTNSLANHIFILFQWEVMKSKKKTTVSKQGSESTTKDWFILLLNTVFEVQM